MATVFQNGGSALRPYQCSAVDGILRHPRCLVKMFCGTGKSIVMTETIARLKKSLTVVVFPSLALVSQFATEYTANQFNGHRMLNISSESLPSVQSSTDPLSIRAFIRGGGPMLILVTYQSYDVLLANLCGVTIGLVCYDEAHHVVSPEYQKLVFETRRGTSHLQHEVFLTATPRNENGVVMYDRLNPQTSRCGPLAYEYTYLDGLRDGVLNAFDVCVDMYTDDRCTSVYAAMARAILTRGTGRVLTFHSGVHGTRNTSVWNFVDQAAFVRVFANVQRAEFPDTSGQYVDITFRGMDGQTSSSDRVEMLRKLDATPNHAVYIISSCETIGEGVDTKRANMCVFADPKSSVTKIIQNIGRVVRPNPSCPRSTVLIPCYVDMAHYADARGDARQQDAVIRAQMRSDHGDYAPILSVLAALRQEDPELYEMCLHYHPSIKPSQTTSTSSRTSVSCGSSESTAESGCDSDVDYDDVESRRDVDERRPQHRIRLAIHPNEEIRLLWRVQTALDFDRKLQSVVIECDVTADVDIGVDRWRRKLAEVRAYIDEHDKGPSSESKELAVKRLGSWIGTQRSNYKNNAYIMKNDSIRAEWEAMKDDARYGPHLANNEEAWWQNLAAVKAYIDRNQKAPSAADKHASTKRLVRWIQIQKANYAQTSQIMQNDGIRAEWEATIGDPRYASHLVMDNTAVWRQTLATVLAYIDQHQKAPSETNKDGHIKRLGHWVSTQKANYKNDACIMKNDAIRAEWEATNNDPRYALHLASNDVAWRHHLAAVKAYIDEHRKAPSQIDYRTHSKTDEDDAISRLGNWISTQKKNYASRSHIMKHAEIRAEWEAMNEDPRYAPHLASSEEAWWQNLAAVKAYIDEHRKAPCENDKDDAVKRLGSWIANQKTNYKHRVRSMQNDAIRIEWEATNEDPRYAPHLASKYEVWQRNLAAVKAYIDEHRKAPSDKHKDIAIKRLGQWIPNQKANYAQTAQIMQNDAIRAEWKATIDDPRYAPHLVIDTDAAWRKRLVEVKAYIDQHQKAPAQSDKSLSVAKLGNWIQSQKRNYAEQINVMKNDAIRAEWATTIDDARYGQYLKGKSPTATPSQSQATSNSAGDSAFLLPCIQASPRAEPKPKQARKSMMKRQVSLPQDSRPPESSSMPSHHPYPASSPIGTLHKTYKRMRSDTLHETFRQNPQLWHEYHAERKRNFASYDPSSIPCNRIIAELAKIRTSRRKLVVDMGCGDACIAHHFAAQSDPRFHFANYDHQSGGDPTIIEVDMSMLPLGDASAEIAIMSLALWGTSDNCRQYVQEAHRVLESGGLFYIIDTTKRWSPEPLTDKNAGELLRALLTSCGFRIVSEDVGLPFCLFVCNKRY